MKKAVKITAVLVIMALTFLLAACGGKKIDEPTATKPTGSGAAYRQISSDEAADMMKAEKDYIILDVRTREEYESGHIPNAVCVPNETIGTADIPELPDKAQLILVYCRSGRRSKEAAQKLADMGYINIVEFGGIIDWKGETVTD